MSKFLASKSRIRRLGIVLAMAPALLLFGNSWLGQAGAPGGKVGPRQAVCTRCWLIFWFQGGSDGSFYTPAGMSRNQRCPACDTSAGYERPPAGPAKGSAANDARTKYQGVAGGSENHKKRQGDLPAAEYAGGDRQLQEDRDRLHNRWKDLQAAENVLGAISDPGKPKLGAPVTPVALETARAALSQECAKHAQAVARLAEVEQDDLLLEGILLGWAMPERKNETAAGLGRLIELRRQTATAYRQLAAALAPLRENKNDKDVQARPYYQPVQHNAELLSPDKRLAAERPFWIDVCNARIRINALLAAVADNSTRHQRASAHNDMRAMAGLATRMIEQIAEARMQGLQEAGFHLDYQRARLDLLGQALKQNPDWKKRWDGLRQQVMATKQVPREMIEAWELLRLPGLPDEKALTTLALLMPADIENRLSERRGRLTVMHDVRTILQKNKVAWPEPHDLALLDRLERFSRRAFPQINAKVLYHVSDFDTGWWAVPTGGTVDFRNRGVMHSSTTTRFLTPGKYDVWLPLKSPNTPDLPPAVRIETGIEIAAGMPLKSPQKPTTFPEKKVPTAFGEFHLRVADGIAPPYSWFLFPQDANYTEQAVKGSSKFAPLKVPVGKYDLYWFATAEHAPLVLARGLKIGEKQSVAWELDSGIRLERGDGIPANRVDGWWGVTLPGQAPVRRLNWTNSSDRLLMPPGEYDVYWVYDYSHLAVRLASAVSVQAKKWTPVRADSGLRVRVSPALPKIETKGWLAAAVSGTNDLVDLRFGDELKTPFVLPAGKFDLLVQFNDKTPSKRFLSGIVVPAAGIVEAALEAPRQK